MMVHSKRTKKTGMHWSMKAYANLSGAKARLKVVQVRLLNAGVRRELEEAIGLIEKAQKRLAEMK